MPKDANVRRIITRKEWGARKPKTIIKSVWRGRPTVWIHHTESNGNPLTFAQECKEMRSIQDFHMLTNDGDKPWSDIGYNYVIFPSGRIFEGRGKNVRGAHCPTGNGEPGIAFYGNFMFTLPTKAALGSFDWLASQLKAGSFKGHRDGWSTNCPGDALYDRFFTN